MTVTAIDPRTALVVIDLQKGIVTLPTAHSSETVVMRAAELAQTFRERGLPVVLVNVAGGAPGRTDENQTGAARSALPADWTELAVALDAQPGDHRVTKHRWGAFSEESLDRLLRELDVTQLVLAGISTSIGVESTARAAYEAGYNVTLAIDAMTDTNLQSHNNSVERIFPRLGETGTTADIIALLRNLR